MTNSAIVSMYRYRVQKFWTELEQKGKPELTVADLTCIDQYHYLGTDAVDYAAQILGITNNSYVLDIGSGIGGTARYLAWKYGCRVAGVELQNQLHRVGLQMNRATGMDRFVNLIEGDFTDLSSLPISTHSFDCWISLNVFLHIGDRQTLFQNCAKVLKPHGKFYIEDYYAAQSLPLATQTALAVTIACPYLPSREQYLEDLKSQGFTDLEFVDMAAVWQPWLVERAAKFDQQRQEYEKLFSSDLIESYSHFYQTVANLFSDGHVSGARIYGTYQP